MNVRASWRLRTLLLMVLGMLLPLPLGWLLYSSTLGTLKARIEEGPVIPILADEQVRGLLTYKRPCQTDEDCTPPLACYFHPAVQSYRCGDSMCLTDAQCEEGYTCRTLRTVGRKAQVRLCALSGRREEGEQCAPFLANPQYHCAPGLLCQEWCGRPCRMGDPESCPAGFFCREGPEGASCLPTCEGRRCPEGQRCVSRGTGISICATVHGQDCEFDPCTQGQECRIDSLPERPGEFWGECLQGCGENDPPCAEGTVCVAGWCYRGCDPQDPLACGPHFRCGRLDESTPWQCLPD